MVIKKDLREEIEIPEGIKTEIKHDKIIMKKNNDEIQIVTNSKVKVTTEGNKIILEFKKATKNNKRMIGTVTAHIKNMIKGLTKKFKYKLQISNVHFPMTVTLDKSKNELVIKNFLGEKKERRIKIAKEVEVKVNKEEIEIESISIEKAGQCAANIEKGTKVRNKDRRIFQDGIFITEKPGRIFK
ncbi:MAG: 50S ribosomal protein L6 [Candidatus Pacearchaeota archaeon]